MSEDPPHTDRPGQITSVLMDVRDGAPGAVDRLMAMVLDDLRQCASGRLARQPVQSELRPTELIHEAYVRLFGPTASPSWNDRRHFFAVATLAMQHILVDRARHNKVIESGAASLASGAQPKRSVSQRETDSYLALHDALGQLNELDPRRCLVIRFKFFAGLTIDEIASVLDLSTATVEREWAAGRVWLRMQLEAV